MTFWEVLIVRSDGVASEEALGLFYFIFSVIIFEGTFWPFFKVETVFSE